MKNLKVPLGMFLIAGAIAYAFSYVYMEQRKQYDFPKTTATLDSLTYRTSKPANTSMYATTAYLAYSYSVDGKTYIGSSVAIDRYGNELSITTETFNPDELEWVKNQRSFEVYYDPNDPSESFSQPHVQSGWLVGAIVSGLFSLLGLVGMFTSLFTGKKNHMLSREQSEQVINEMQRRIKDKT